MDIVYIHVITRNFQQLELVSSWVWGQVLVGSPNLPTNLDTKSPGKARLDYYWKQVLSRVIKDEIAAMIQSRSLRYPPHPQSPILMGSIG